MHPTLLHLGRFLLPTFGALAAAGLMSALSLSLRTACLAGGKDTALYRATAAPLIPVALYKYLSRHPQPGQPLALALASSGVVQFLITFLRQPNEALDFDSRSLIQILDPIQWVSLVMVFAAGVILL